MFNKKIQRFSIRKLTVGAASVLIGLSFISMNNNDQVQAAENSNAKSEVKAKSPEEIAKDNVESAKKNVETTKTNRDNAQTALDNAKKEAQKPNKDYDAQNEKTSAAQKQEQDKKAALDKANSDQSNAQKLVEEAKKPGAIENAQKDVKAKTDNVASKKSDLKAAQDKTGAAQKAIDDANKDITAKKSDLAQKQADKAKADSDVKLAQDALKGTGLDKAANELNSAKSELNTEKNNQAAVNKEIPNKTAEVEKAKSNVVEAQKNKQAADQAKANAQKEYDSQKAGVDAAVKQADAKKSEIANLNKELDRLKELSKNTIVIPDKDKFLKALNDYMETDNLTPDDIEYMNWATDQNKYIPSGEDEKVYANNITDKQLEEISLFTVDILNKVRAQLGFLPDQVSKGAMEFAKKVAAGYIKDNWSADKWHDGNAINDAAKEMGLSSVEGADRNVHQAYEDMGGGGAYYGYATMDYLKGNIYANLLSMILPDGNGYDDPSQVGGPGKYEMGHTMGVLNLTLNDEDELEGNQGKSLIETSRKTFKKLKNDLLTSKKNLETLKEKVQSNDISSNQSVPNIKITLNDDSWSKEYVDRFKVIFNPTKNSIEYEINTKNNGNWHLEKVSKEKFINELDKRIENHESENSLDQKLATLDKIEKSSDQINQFVSAIPTCTDHTIDGRELWGIHIFNISPYQIKDPSKFDTEIIPSYADQKANITKQISDANNAYAQLQKDIQAKSTALTQAQDKLNVATANAKTFDQNVANAQKNVQTLSNALQQLLEAQKYYAAQIPKTQANVQAKQKVYDALTASNKQKADNYNNALKAQNNAYQTVKSAESALTDANNQLAAAKKAQQDLAKDIQNKQTALDNANKELNAATTHLSDLKNADSLLATAKQVVQKASDEYKAAQKNVNDNEAQLKTLEAAKNKANDKVAAATKTLTAAQSAYDKAKAKLADAEQKLYDIEHPYVPVADTTNVGQEEAMTGVAHVPSPSDMNGAEVELVDGQGKATGKYIPTNSNWKVLAKKTINGQTYYRLGTDKQWINAKFVSEVSKPEASSEQAMSGVVYIPVINHNANYKVALHDSNGRLTGKYISTNSNWKVFARKAINGQTYYRIGNENQWIPAQYASANNEETKLSGVAHVPVIHNNRNWKVALLDGNGHVTGKYISTNSNWKVLAKKNVNGRELVRLGSDLQWIPMEYVAWIR